MTTQVKDSVTSGPVFHVYGTEYIGHETVIRYDAFIHLDGNNWYVEEKEVKYSWPRRVY